MKCSKPRAPSYCFLIAATLAIAGCSDSNEKPTWAPAETTETSANVAEHEQGIPATGAAIGPAIDESPIEELTEEEVAEYRFCEGSMQGAQSIEIPLMAKPELLEAYNDPAFGGRVIRITDSAFGEVNKPLYSTMQAWNADESLLLLYRTGTDDTGHKLYDGHSYEFIESLDITPSDIEEIWWSRTEPDHLFYVSKRADDFGLFKRLNVRDRQSAVIADFSHYCGSGLPTAGNDVQMHANNDDLFGFRCRQDDGHYIMFSYQPSTDQVTVAPLGSGSQWNEYRAPAAMASGASLWHQGSILEPDLVAIRSNLDMASTIEHSSLGMTSSGQDAFYQVSFDGSPAGCDGDLYRGVGHLVEHNASTGACRNIISQENGYPYPTSGTHISATAYLKPGRVALSSIGTRDQHAFFSNGLQAPALLSEIYIADTDPGNPVVCRLAHHRSTGKYATNGGYTAYFGEPHATMSPSGSRVIFGSDWYDSGSVDSYVLELSDYRRQ